MGNFSAKEKARAAERETALRRNVYPSRVLAGKMTRIAADREIGLMAEIAADYRALADKDAPELFPK